MRFMRILQHVFPPVKFGQKLRWILQIRRLVQLRVLCEFEIASRRQATSEKEGRESFAKITVTLKLERNPPEEKYSYCRENRAVHEGYSCPYIRGDASDDAGEKTTRAEKSQRCQGGSAWAPDPKLFVLSWNLVVNEDTTTTKNYRRERKSKKGRTLQCTVNVLGVAQLSTLDGKQHEKKM